MTSLKGSTSGERHNFIVEANTIRKMTVCLSFLRFVQTGHETETLLFYSDKALSFPPPSVTKIDFVWPQTATARKDEGRIGTTKGTFCK